MFKKANRFRGRGIVAALSLLAAASFWSAGAIAQLGGAAVSGATSGASSGAASGTQSAPSSSTSGITSGARSPAPQLQLQPVQTPTITNQQQTQQTQPTPSQLSPRDAAANERKRREGNSSSLETADKNDFQDFIAVSTGNTLPLFGYNLFQNVPSTFAPVDNVPVTADYTVGPGDELQIRAWGQIDVDYRAVVDRNGQISIPRVGVINVAGIKYQDLTAYVKTAVARNFRNFELLVTMGHLRSIQIFVVGQASRSGTYTVSSLSTLVNAIFAAGGPSTHGSMRGIQLKRGDRTVAEMDLYDLLLNGDKSRDTLLLPGDVIYFPTSGPLVALAGSVKTPAIFELKGETQIGKLIEWAGGLSTTAQTKLATIERIDERRTRSVDQFSLDAPGLARGVKDGDLVTVFSISPKIENAVTLRGNVAAPLRYPYREGMRIRDLIPEKNALITPDYYRKNNLAARIDFTNSGQVRAEVLDLLAEINWDYATIERMNDADLTVSLIPFNLGKAVNDGDAENNLVLKAGDIVTVFSKADLNVSMGQRVRYVRLEGEFNRAGVYQVLPGETLRQLIARVGGLTPNAYLFGAEFTRLSTQAQQQINYEDALSRMERDAQAQVAARAQNVITAEDASAINAQRTAQESVIARLRQLKPTGRVVLEMPEQASFNDVPDIALEDGDRMFVPARPSMVNVFGSVYAENSFLYRPDKRVSDYVAQAGGTTKRADPSHMFVLRADGSVKGRASGFFSSGVGGNSVAPGDTIVVPEDFERTTWLKDLRDWSQVFFQFGLGAAAIKVLTR